MPKYFPILFLLGLLISRITAPNILHAGSINVDSASFSPGQSVSFSYAGATSNCIVWDFGDGSVRIEKNNTANFSHSFSNPGSYLVKAWDTQCDDGGQPSATKSVVITSHDSGNQPRHTITSDAVKFTLKSVQLRFKNGSRSINVLRNKKGFKAYAVITGKGSGSIKLQWFVDNQPFSHLLKQINLANGKQVVIDSIRDLPTLRTGGSHRVTLKIQTPNRPNRLPGLRYTIVSPTNEKDAAFKLTSINLRFKKGSTYTTVTKNLARFKAYADLTYKGSGALQVQWIIDNKPFSIKSYLVHSAQQTSINSGHDLPTMTPGSHTVSIRVFSPSTRLTIPTIKYYVSANKKDKQHPADIEIKFRSVVDERGKSRSFSGTHIQAKRGEYIILYGDIINKSNSNLAKATLQTYLESKLVASQATKQIITNNSIPFEVSLRAPDITKSQVMLKLIDKSANIISTKKLTLFEKPPVLPPVKKFPKKISIRKSKIIFAEEEKYILMDTLRLYGKNEKTGKPSSTGEKKFYFNDLTTLKTITMDTLHLQGKDQVKKIKGNSPGYATASISPATMSTSNDPTVLKTIIMDTLHLQGKNLRNQNNGLDSTIANHPSSTILLSNSNDPTLSKTITMDTLQLHGKRQSHKESGITLNRATGSITPTGNNTNPSVSKYIQMNTLRLTGND